MATIFLPSTEDLSRDYFDDFAILECQGVKEQWQKTRLGYLTLNKGTKNYQGIQIIYIYILEL